MCIHRYPSPITKNPCAEIVSPMYEELSIRRVQEKDEVMPQVQVQWMNYLRAIRGLPPLSEDERKEILTRKF